MSKDNFLSLEYCKQFIGYQIMKTGKGSTFNGEHFVEIIGVMVKHPYRNNPAFLLDNGSYISTTANTAIILDENKLLILDEQIELILENRELTDVIGSVQLNRTYWRCIGRYLINTNQIDSWDFDNVTLEQGNFNFPKVSRPSYQDNDGIRFQHFVCGSQETYVEADNIGHWADGVSEDTIYEVKYVDNIETAYYCGNGYYGQEKVDGSIIKQFKKIKHIVDNHSKYNRIVLITNAVEVQDYICDLLQSVNIEIESEVVNYD